MLGLTALSAWPTPWHRRHLAFTVALLRWPAQALACVGTLGGGRCG